MNDSIWFLLLIQILLIFLNAVFASAEIAVLSANELKIAKLAEQGNKRAIRLSHLTENPAKFLATIQVAITLSGFLGSAFAAENFSDSLVALLVGLGVGIPEETLNTIAVIVITLILSYFTLIFGELVPKRIAMKKAEALAMGISGMISGISTVFTPLVWLLSISTNAVLRLIGIDPNEAEEEVSEEEIRMMVDAGSKKGAIDHEESEFIQNVFEFDDLMVSEISTHRTDTIFLRMEDDDAEWASMIHNSRHTLYPICENSPDHVVGILNAKDYFRLEDKSRTSVLQGAVKPAYFVPETMKADVLFRNLKKKGYSMAVLLDEYGGMSGIITQNDLLEQLVGDLNNDDELFDDPDPYLEKLGEDTWRVHGNISLRDLEDILELELPYEQFDTFTGLIFDQLGMIPKDGSQKLQVQLEPFSVVVTSVQDHQVEDATIRLCPKQQPTPDAD